MAHQKKLFSHYTSCASCKWDHARSQRVLNHNLAQRGPRYSLINPKDKQILGSGTVWGSSCVSVGYQTGLLLQYPGKNQQMGLSGPDALSAFRTAGGRNSTPVNCYWGGKNGSRCRQWSSLCCSAWGEVAALLLVATPVLVAAVPWSACVNTPLRKDQASKGRHICLFQLNNHDAKRADDA